MADTAHPADSLIAAKLLSRPACPSDFALVRSWARKSAAIPAELGRHRGAFWIRNAQLRWRRGLSRACVVGKNKALWELGQYHCLKFCCRPGMGIATKFGALRCNGIQAKPFSGDVERRA
jgi:hypothetical protein